MYNRSAPDMLIVSFGKFAFDRRNRRLWKDGVPVKLQRKPLQILELLLQTPGDLVTRDRIAKQLWPELHVSYEGSLNTAINGLRDVLGDSSSRSEFIQTYPGLGYTFVAPVQSVLSATDESPPAPRSSRAESEAHADYLKGCFFYRQGTGTSLTKAAALFSASCEADPTYAEPRAGLAHVENRLALSGSVQSAEAGRRARRHATVALDLDAHSAQAYVAHATALHVLYADADLVEAEYRKALELEDRCGSAYCQYAEFLCASGRLSEAVEMSLLAQRLEPTSPLHCLSAAVILYAAGDHTQMIEQCWKALLLQETLPAAGRLLGLAYEAQGLLEDAFTELENAAKADPDEPATLAALAHLRAGAGRKEEAQQSMEELRALASVRFVSPYWFAVGLTALGRRAAAMECLFEARRSEDAMAQWIGAEPRFAPLADDARFAELAASTPPRQTAVRQRAAFS